MKLEKTFQVRAAPDDVWLILSDVSAVAECIPGFELQGEVSPGVYDGQFKVRVGPITAKLAGQGSLQIDEVQRFGRVEGKGVDRRGGSRASGLLEYRVTPVSGGTEISIDADVQLSGPLAQVGRTGIVQDIADQLTTEFASNLEKRITSGEASFTVEADTNTLNREVDPSANAPSAPRGRSASADEFNAGSAFWSSLLRRLAALFGRKH